VTVEKKASRWEDLVDVFFSPAELFRRRANDSAKPAFFTLLVLAVVIYYAFLPVNQETIRIAMETQAAARGQDPTQMGTAAKFMGYFGGITMVIGLTLAILLTALALWVIGRLVEVKGTYRQAFMIVTYASFVTLLALIAISVVSIIGGDGLDQVRGKSFGLLRFIDTESMPPTVRPLLTLTEIWALWQAVLWAVGMCVVMKATKAQAAIAAIGTWLLSAVPGLISAAFGFGQQAAG